jgi:protein-S-isoprenylcysteine O-methyltransferase Ste14
MSVTPSRALATTFGSLAYVGLAVQEVLLRAHFGSEYEAYCARTSRLIPGVY